MPGGNGRFAVRYIHISPPLLLSGELEPSYSTSQGVHFFIVKTHTTVAGTQGLSWWLNKANTHEIVPTQLLIWKANPFKDGWINPQDTYGSQQGLCTICDPQYYMCLLRSPVLTPSTTPGSILGSFKQTCFLYFKKICIYACLHWRNGPQIPV